jgi:hypothetical protein
MSSLSSTISIASVIQRKVELSQEKASPCPPKWLSVACLILGLVVLSSAHPLITQTITSYLPGFTHIVGANVPTFLTVFGLLSIGLIGQVKLHYCSKKIEWKPEDNLLKLFQRERGEKLVVEKEKGVLKTMGLGQKILRYCIPSYRKKLNRELKETIDALTSRIKLEENSPEGEKQFIRELFLEKLSPLSRKIYKRVLNPCVTEYLKGQVTITGCEPGVSEDFRQKFKSAKFWARLGNFKRPKNGAGGGSYVSIEGGTKSCLGIYKPSDEDSLAKNSPHLRQKIRYLFAKTIFRPFSELAFQTLGGQAYIAEVAANKVGQFVTTACLEYPGDNA